MSQCTIINKQFACRLGRSKIIRFLEDQHHWALDINKSEYICVIDNTWTSGPRSNLSFIINSEILQQHMMALEIALGMAPEID